MAILVELDPETEARLVAEARVRGLAIGDYASVVLRNAGPMNPSGDGRPTAQSLQAMFDALAQGSENLPVLPEEAFERESFYKDRC
jgi:hypothetical protein